MWLLPMGMASSGWIGRCTLGLAFTPGFIFSELPEKPANLPHLKTRWARSVFPWYDYLAAVFVASLGTTGVMLRVDALTNFTQQVLQDSQKAISALNAEQINLKGGFTKQIGLRYSDSCTRKNVCYYSYPMLYIYT